jgi:hypothetical protein
MFTLHSKQTLRRDDQQDVFRKSAARYANPRPRNDETLSGRGFLVRKAGPREHPASWSLRVPSPFSRGGFVRQGKTRGAKWAIVDT